MKPERRIMLLSFIVSALLWLADVAFDARYIYHRPFFAELFEFNLREIYYRVFLVAGVVGIGLYAARSRAKQRQIEERYKNIVELTDDIIYVADKDGNQVFWNDAAYRIMERTPDEVMGRSFLLSIHPDDRERSLAKRKEIVGQQLTTFKFENRYVSKRGRVINFLHNIRVLKDAKGAIIGTQGIARDITEQKQFEKQLQDAIARAENEKARTEGILAAIGDGISIQDTDFRILYQNQIQRNMTVGEKAGLKCYEAYAGEAAICSGCPVAQSFKDGMIHTLEKTVSRNGEVRTLEIKSSPLRDSAGAIIAGIEAVRDITLRKKAQEKLKLFSEAIEEAMDGIQIVDLDGVVLYSNKAVTDIYGYTFEELYGKQMGDMNADLDIAGRVIVPAIRNAGRWSGELMVVHKNGTVFPIWLSSSLVKDDSGVPIAMIGIIRDITDRKQAENILKRHHEQLMKLVEERTVELSSANEKLRREIADRERMEQELLKSQKLESLGILAGGIAHDFNNLLASIMGNISLAMLDLKPGHEVLHQLEAAERASIRAQDLTRQLLTFSKGGAPIKKVTSIAHLVKEAAGFALRGSRVRCTFIIADDLRYADVDEGQISQVVHNLVINADHAMPSGGTITIRCENEVVSEASSLMQRSGNYVKLSVQDSGVGISREHIMKIFDPYFTTKQKGSGLGLATSYSIIKKHGGHIFAKSELGKGTTFIVYLPASRKAGTVTREFETPLRTGIGRVLLMDDEEDVRRTTGDVLKRLGYTVAFAADGEQAIELYQKEKEKGAPFAAVIMDLTVPGGMGGKEALETLLERSPEVKAIVSSGYSNDPIMSDYKKYGFCGVVTKPYRIKDLGETLFSVIQGDAQNDHPRAVSG